MINIKLILNKKAIMCKRKILIIFQIVVAITVQAQVNMDAIQQMIKISRTEIPLQYPDYIKDFYRSNGFNYVWLNSENDTEYMLQLLQTAADFGLEEEDYQFEHIQSFRNTHFIRPTHLDSLATEVRLTDAAIHFFKDIAYGNRKPAIGFNGLNYDPDCFDIPALMAAALAENRLSRLVKDIEPELPGYQTLKDWLNLYNQSIKDSAFREIKITSTRSNIINQPLIRRLYYLGIIDSLNVSYSDAALREKVRSAQRLFNLMSDGILNKLTIEALNTSLFTRIEEVRAAINTIRWLRCASMHTPVFVVNIPSANLLVLHNGKVLQQSKVIVGKRSTPTPTLASTITDVVLYPYWNVPNKIATRELLPLIQKNSGYLAANNMQVLNKSGRILDPGSINWNSLSPSYFPYVLRQSTGCDNSLGLVKLNFYSPYSVYLHDTPWKVLFNLNKRYYSHGCIRVEKAMELGRFLLKGNTIAIDTLEEKGCLRNQAPLPIPVTGHTPVFVLYNTAWFDSTGIVQFNEDVYKKINFDQINFKKATKKVTTLQLNNSTKIISKINNTHD
jgi:L,D-transpeptidase YcbB